MVRTSHSKDQFTEVTIGRDKNRFFTGGEFQNIFIRHTSGRRVANIFDIVAVR